MDSSKEELIIAELYASLERVKAMVKVLYEPRSITLEKVRELARIAKLNFEIGASDGNNIESEIFDTLPDVATFLIDKILNNKTAVEDFKKVVNKLKDIPQ
jgi:DNA-directed RNA polymerase sigma subunit (sigma70/sigma32)